MEDEMCNGNNIYSGIIWSSWRKCFAWTPMKIHSEYIWMKTYYKRNLIYQSKFFEYGTIFDVLKEE